MGDLFLSQTFLHDFLQTFLPAPKKPRTAFLSLLQGIFLLQAIIISLSIK
jgi:hypothetical protein